MHSTSCKSFLSFLSPAKPELIISPGGYLDPSETFEEGLITRLNEQLGIPQNSAPNWLQLADGVEDWKVGNCVSTWWRPNFDTFFVSYDSFR